MKATLIRANMEETDIVPANGNTFTLEELQGYVGGMIEIHNLPDRKNVIVINEEGLSLNLPHNRLATIMGYNLFTLTDGVVGDVVVCDPSMIR